MKKRNILVLGLFFLVLSLTVIGCGDKAPTQETLAGEQKLAIRLATDYRQGSIGYQQLENFAPVSYTHLDVYKRQVEKAKKMMA